MLLFYWVLSALEFLIRTNHVSCFKGVCLIQPGLATCFDDYDKENLDSCGPQRLDVKILLGSTRQGHFRGDLLRSVRFIMVMVSMTFFKNCDIIRV